jgi:uridylate cyclase
MSDEFGDAITKIFSTTWDSRDGQVVPKTEDVALSNGAVKLDAVFLYADLAHSTQLARTFPRSMAAKIVRAYLSSMTRLVNVTGGHVRSFDGDRVMGVYVGDSKNSSAAKCALQMNYVVEKLLRPKAEEQFSSLKEKGFVIRHCVGVASSDVLVVRSGVRGSNDLVFIGSSPNIAAKLSDQRDSPYHSYITSEVYGRLEKKSKIGSDERDMWSAVKLRLSGEEFSCYKSSWTWKP